MSISTIQKTRKRKKRFFLGLGATSRLTVPDLRHPSTPKSRPKRHVEPSEETKLPIPLNLQDPFFRLVTHGKRVVFPLRSSQRGQLLLTKLATFPVGIEPPGPWQGGKFNTQGCNRRKACLSLEDLQINYGFPPSA